VGVGVGVGVGDSAGRSTLSRLAASLVLLSTASADAGGFHVSVIGGRRNGMLANLAAPDDVTAVFHNPAALADLHGARLELFGSAAFLSNEFRMAALDPGLFPEINPRGCGETGAPACPWPIGEDGYYTAALSPESTFGVLPFLGFGTDLEFLGDGLEDVGVGLAAYAPDFYGGVLSSSGPPAYFMTDGYFVVAAATLGLGWRVADWLALGFNVSYNYMRLAYGQKVSLVDALTPPGEEPGGIAGAVQDVYGDALMEFDGVDHGAGWTASVLLTPASWLSLAVVYSGSTDARFEGPLGLRPTREGVESFADLEELGFDLPRGLEVEMPIPPAINFGLNVRPHRRVEIGLDFRLWLYTLYSRQTIRPLYDADQTGTPAMTEEDLSRDKRYDLSWEAALGFLYRPPLAVPGLELMCGVGYDQSPVPDEYFFLDNPSLSTVLMSAGVRWRLDEHWRATLAYIGMVYVGRDIRNSQTSPPANVRGGGSNHMPSLEVEYRF
jgi:long-subunit fatty acid transport protein